MVRYVHLENMDRVMPVTKKTYAEFILPGFLFLETEVVRVKSRDIRSLLIPETAYSLRFFDVLITEVSNGKKKVKVKSRPVNYSDYYYIGTRIYSKKQMADQTAREHMMKEITLGKFKDALRCRFGGFIPLKKGERVILINGKKREVVKVK